MTAEGASAQDALTSGHPSGRRARGRLGAIGLAAVMMAHAAPASGQTAEDMQVWTSVVTSGAVHDMWRVHSELHARWVDDAQHYQRTVLRLMGGRTLTPHMTAWFGFEQTWPFAGRAPEETRIWQQVIYVQPAGRWSLSHRGRLEERFLEGADRMVPRLRYSLRATRLLSSAGGWGLIVGEEMFFQLRKSRLNGRLYPAGFDRNRVLAGISSRLTRNVTVEPSYTLQFINSPEGVPNRREHLLQLQVVHRF
jgi:Protein of unknown function (DUF2490)